jgi:hypothetical protein
MNTIVFDVPSLNVAKRFSRICRVGKETRTFRVLIVLQVCRCFP